ncbi:hypothetical protein C9994_00880 [Marivirga lumbricoides]|uniref:FAS1 domain-containing protein n=1 Tax=Marivirga lumbricoides TaxID=1046115 RepID=A0A2T4DVS5_9BACT|nr:hypothetical protein C9994_00880 [Marivirga lumbricoides]
MKKNNLFLKLSSTLMAVVFLAMSSVMLSSCDDEDEGGDPEPTMNITQTLADLGGYDSLIKYVSVYPDLVTLLNNSDAKTLFAPNNAAFRSLLETPGFPQDITSINPTIIKGVLQYHVVLGSEVTSAELTGSVTTAYEDEEIEVNANGTLKTGATNQAITLGDTDIMTTTGIIHEVNSVLIPPTVGASLTPILGTVSGTILLGADFSQLAIAVNRVDAARSGRGDTPIANILASRSGSYTVFAPVNGSFQAAGIDVTTADVATLEAALLLHVIADANLSSADIAVDIQAGAGSTTYTTLGGEILVAPSEFQGNATIAAGGAAVVSADNVTGNGTVHAVFGVVVEAE